MKKIILVIFCVFFVCLFSFGLFGCAVAPTVPTLTGRKPWQFSEYSDNHERIDFVASRFGYENSSSTLHAAGELSFVLKENGETASLSTQLSLTYNDNTQHSGKSNTVSSSVVFSKGDLAPISSSRTLHHGAVVPTKGYTASVDYLKRTSEVSLESGESGTYNLKSGEYYDNEQLYHILRSIPELGAGKTYTFKLVTAYDMFVRDKYFTHQIEVTVAGTLEKLEVPKAIYDMAIGRTGEDSGKLNDGGKYFIDCKQLKVSLADDKSGPSFYVYLSDLNFIDNETIRADETKHDVSFTKNVPIKIVVSEYSITNTLLYTNEYEIKNYSTVKIY